MSTFIVRVLKARAETIRGQIEHVRTGERSAFSSAEQLLAFLRNMDAVDSGTMANPNDQEGNELKPEERHPGKASPQASCTKQPPP